MVMEGQRRGGQGSRRRRVGRQLLDEMAEAVAKDAEPAAADHRVRGLHDGLLVEQGEGILAGVRDTDRLGAEQRAAAGPVAHQRERTGIAAQSPHRLVRSGRALEGDANGAHARRLRAEARGRLARYRRRTYPPRMVRRLALWSTPLLGVALLATPAPAAARVRCRGHRATIVGTRRNDVITGTKRRDVIVAKGGNDKIKARGGRDIVCAGPGDDRVDGGGGGDVLDGGGGADDLTGRSGADRLYGGGGSDVLDGGSGLDAILGGGGKDTGRGGGVPHRGSGGGGGGRPLRGHGPRRGGPGEGQGDGHRGG